MNTNADQFSFRGVVMMPVGYAQHPDLRELASSESSAENTAGGPDKESASAAACDMYGSVRDKAVLANPPLWQSPRSAQSFTRVRLQ
jgi:hypothetical protein